MFNDTLASAAARGGFCAISNAKSGAWLVLGPRTIE
jgi:hypothetical protein